MKLSSNQQLYEYLFFLISELKNAGDDMLAQTVAVAAAQASSTSTEFLGESRIALRQVLSQENGVLTQEGREDLMSVIDQISQALDHR